jgi:hypothetical protein
MEEEMCTPMIDGCHPIPRPLSRLLPSDHHQQWQKTIDGHEWLDLTITDGHSHALLFRCAPGFTVQATGITLILDGALESQTKRYGRGHVLMIGHEAEPMPVADRSTGCLSLLVTTHRHY